jgi:pimeloyl-ACP methyl ester carboxylesterase
VATNLNIHRAGSGEPMLLLHGLGATLRVWLPVAPLLAERHDVIAMDLPGYGDSPPLPEVEGASLANYADAVEEQLDELGVGSVHVVGNSMGGWISLELARRGRARTLVAIAPVGLGTEEENRTTRGHVERLYAAANGVDPMLVAMSKTAVGRTLLYGRFAARPAQVEPDEVVRSVRAFGRSSNLTEALDWFMSNRPEGLEEIRCPVTIVWGTGDRLVPSVQAERFREHIPHAEVRLLNRLGHAPMSDDPELVAETILAGVAKRQATRT